jgi:hypothetical protein
MKYTEKILLSKGPSPRSIPELLISGSQIRTIGSQIIFYQNSKLEDSRLKNGEKIVKRQTDRQTGLMNSTEQIFFLNML